MMPEFAESRDQARTFSDAGADLRPLSPRVDTDPESVAHGLAGLVLTIVELLRQLMERQAIRRIDQGDLTDDQIERMGRTLLALERRMTELCEHFDVEREELNIDLGPLGPLLAESGPR